MGPRATSSRCIAISLSCLGALAAQAPIVCTGAHFAVHVHPGATAAPVAQRIGDSALAAAESMWPVLEKSLGVKTAKPATLHVYCDVAAFRALAGAPPFRAELVRFDAQEAHVALQPVLSPKALELVGLPDPTAHALMRGAAMLVAAQGSPAVAADPWLGEVLAWGLLEELTNPTHEFGLDPAYDSRRWPVVRKLDASEPLVLRSTIFDFSVPATRDAADEADGHRAMLARTMAAVAKDWAKKLLAKPPKKAGTPTEVRGAAVDRVLGSDWVKTESLFNKLHLHVKPMFHVTAPMAARRDGKILCAGTSTESMHVQAAQAPKPGPYTIRGTFTVQPCNDDGLRIQLDWDQKSLVGVFLHAGKWSVERWEVGGQWTKLAGGPAPLTKGVPWEIAVVVDKNVRVLLGDQEIAAWDYGERKMRGRWAIGVNDCVVTIDGLRCEQASGPTPASSKKK
jgi:hypothetical protein